MTELINKLYYMVEDWAGQQYEMDEETKSLEDQKLAMEEEIVRRIGDDGQDLVEEFANLSLKLDSIHDKALFRAAVSLGVELAREPAGEAM